MWQDKGFIVSETEIADAMQRLSSYLEEIPKAYLQFSSNDLLRKPGPGKWSKKEILGHLIDSALNNLKRFTEIQFLPQPYIVQPYKQDELVAVNNYQQLELEHLLRLWQALNQQILDVVRNIPADKLGYPVHPQYGNNELQSLKWIICDYVAHMEHHMKQIQAKFTGPQASL